MGKQSRMANVSDSQFADAVSKSSSFRDLASKFSYNIDSGSCKTVLKNRIKRQNLDISHFTGQAWNKNNFDYSRFVKSDKPCKPAHFRQALLALRGCKCEMCGRTTWLGKPINLEVHHVNGDRSDNRLENLQLLCLNCHSYTPNFRNRRRE